VDIFESPFKSSACSLFSRQRLLDFLTHHYSPDVV
jgi:hypothetical protein